MIGYTAKYYTILPQTRMIKKVAVEVAVKKIKIFPTLNKAGETIWMRLVEPFSQVLLADRRNPDGLPIKIKLRQLLNGKTELVVDNMLITDVPSDPWHVVPIQRESAKPKVKPKVSKPLVFPNVEQGKEYLITTFGGLMANAVYNLLVDGLKEVPKAQKRKAA